MQDQTPTQQGSISEDSSGTVKPVEAAVAPADTGAPAAGSQAAETPAAQDAPSAATAPSASDSPAPSWRERIAAWRRHHLSRRLMQWARRSLPALSETEREALEAGDVWWDAELFSGKPDWNRLLATPIPNLTEREAAFLAGPIEQLCTMIDDWSVTWNKADLSPEVWAFLKEHKFFGMIIPVDHGGLGFSAYAHSEVIRKIAAHSVTAATTVLVPNSLGPAELLLQFGTADERQYWLPRLADGREIPCFALTSADAGSDAAAMTDTGVVFRGDDGALFIRLNWAKRYITLGPVATVLGLAFKLSDPDHLLGDKEDIGITLALVPTNLQGVDIGRRHLPAFQFFQNGPTRGHDVVIPVDHIIGGRENAGKGWRMLMSALAAGRGISLPSQSAAGIAFAARMSGAYARVRRQFNVPIGRFEGIQEPLGRLAANTYLVDAARRLTCAGLDEGRKLAVISAIMKLHATERMRQAINDALDIHGGKAVIDGPHNYLAGLYRGIPIAITVEGANILTRNLIIFGQGAIRCHPYLLKVMETLRDGDEERALDDFDREFWNHAGHTCKLSGRAWWHNWTGGLFAAAPIAGRARGSYRQLSRYAVNFALMADFALATLGGTLKRREMLSARLGDVLSELYLLSATLKRWLDEGRRNEDWPLVAWAMARGLATIETRLDQTLANLPNRPVAWLLRFIMMPLGRRRREPRDWLTQQCAELLLEPSEARDRLTAGLFLGREDDGVARLERAFTLVTETEPIRQRIHDAKVTNWSAAAEAGIITAAEAEQMAEAQDAVEKAIAVDDFAANELARRGDQ